MEELTLMIVKPDAVRRRLVGIMLSEVERLGLDIVGVKMFTLSEKDVCDLYQQHVGREWFKNHMSFMTSGLCVFALIQGNSAVQRVRDAAGATPVQDARPGTIRRLYGRLGRPMYENLVHTSDSRESAVREASLFFPEFEDKIREYNEHA